MSSSGAILLPEDVVIQILSRLPVKSLLRFKCVCKYWYTLIKSPCFIGQHYHHHNNRTQLLVHYPTPDTCTSAFALFPDERLAICQNLDYLQMRTCLADVVGPVNGLFLLHTEWCTHGSHLALWNPATREFRTLPGLDSNLPRHFTANNNYFGFGIDSLTNDYKVIWIRYFWDEKQSTLDDTPVIGVYTLGTDSWRLLDPDSASMPPDLSTHSSIYMNGAHYWYDNGDHNPTIVAFDMRNEVFRVIQAPPECTLGCLSLYNDSIAFISWKALESEVSVDVWVLEQEGCWTKHFCIGSIPDVWWLLGLWKNDELFFQTKSLELALYNLNSHEIRNIGVKSSKYGVIKVFKYKESLVSVNVGNNNLERYSLSDILQDFFTYKGPKCEPRSGSICVFCFKFKDHLSL